MNTYPQLFHHPVGLAVITPASSISLIAGGVPVGPLHGGLHNTIDPHHPGVVCPAQKTQDPIYSARVTPWDHHFPIPAQSY